MKGISITDILKLSVPERIKLVGDIWDSVSQVPEAVALTEAQCAELDRRLEAFHKNPNAGSPWEEVRKHIQRAK